MKVLDENGQPKKTKGGFDLQIARTNNDPKSYPICGGKNRSGFPCGRKAGWGTDHVGVGRCKQHGGRKESHSKHLLKLMGDSEIVFPGIKTEFNRLAENRDVFDLREHIFLLEAIMITVLQNAKTVEDLPLVAKMISDASKIVQRLDEIEHGRRLVIDIQGVHLILAQVKAIVFRHIPDSYTRNLIATDLRELPVGGASDDDLASIEQDGIESGVAVES